MDGAWGIRISYWDRACEWGIRMRQCNLAWRIDHRDIAWGWSMRMGHGNVA